MKVPAIQVIALPLLIAAAVATNALHQPGNPAGAYAGGGSAVYLADIVGTPAAQRAAPPMLRRMPATGAVPAAPAATLAVAPVAVLATHAASPAPRATFDVRSRPSISPGQIDRILAAYGSPMAGDGPQLYQLGVKYGIDPAFCVAFFVNESAAGTRGEAVLTHNLGNIRASAGEPSLDGYRYYATWLAGAEDWYRLVSDLYVKQWGLTTPDAIIPVYAPSADDNDPSTYIMNVEHLVATWRAQG